MNPILVLFAHPAFQRSRVNRRLVAAVQGLDGVTFHDLYEAYPDFHIDVRREQALLDAHQIIVFQHPFFWYSTPAILKEWQDLVLEHGWAYGHDGTALKGKQLLSVITAGGSESAYRQEGTNRCTVPDLLRPIERTAALCGMSYLPPFVVYGTHDMLEGAISTHAADYRSVLTALRDNRLDLARIPRHTRLNANLSHIIT
jgi:glutathione-regulated potassium-efflux system ancillary protein KefG